ncbi:MAG: hypothetical protein ACOVQH_06195 [Burkholderiaceae bacterium]|jgi:hypothetical protein
MENEPVEVEKSEGEDTETSVQPKQETLPISEPGSEGEPKAKRGRGRPPGSKTKPANDNVTPPVEVKAKPVAKNPLDSDSAFSDVAEAARARRARANADAWFPYAIMASRTGETLGKKLALKQAIAKGANPEHAERKLSKLPAMASVKVALPDGSTQTVEQLQAGAIAIIAGYLLPFRPDHPVLMATGQLVMAQLAWSEACERALAGE